jgi:hypothetical protein
MAKCFVAFGKGLGYGSDNGFWYEDIFCANTVSYQYESTNPYTGNTPWERLVVDGIPTQGQGHYPGTGTILIIEDYPLANQYCPSPRGGRSGNCDSCLSPPKKYDCINGECVESSIYNTPGIYQSISDCEVNCGAGCSGKCLSNSDWAQIENLASQLKSKNCS